MMHTNTDRALVQEIVALTARHKLEALEISCYFAEQESVSQTQEEIARLLEELVEGGTLQSIRVAQESLYRPAALSPEQRSAWDALDRAESAAWIDENTTLNGFYGGRLHYLNATKKAKVLDHDSFNHVTEPGRNPCELIVDGKTYVQFTSNDYLGLSQHPDVIEAASRALETYGLGTGGSRLANGTLPPHRALERTIARFKGAEDAIVTNTGYMMNLVLTTLAAEGCVIFSDALNHASIIDGARMSRARVVRFAHNDMADLEQKLAETPASLSKYIIVEGTYSMDGDIAKLDELVPIARRHGARIGVDEAHSAGTLGARGRGVIEHFGLDPALVDFKAGTLGKGMGACGGYIAAPHLVTDMLKYTARPFVFSTSLPAAVLAGTNKAYEVLEQHPELARRVQSNARYLRGQLQEMGFDTGLSETQIIPVIVGDDHKLGQLRQALLKAGLWAVSVAYPVVPRHQSRLRLSVTAAHSQAQMDRLLEALGTHGKALGII